jgi:tyrosine-protein kinase Etk/Wzc
VSHLPPETTIVHRGSSLELVPAPPDFGVPSSDPLEFFQILTILRQNKRFILKAAFWTFAAVLGLTLVSSMQFESTARVYLGELEKQPARGADDMDLSGGGHGDTATEIEILNSRTLIMRAILASGLNVQIKPPGWSPPRYWRWLSSFRSPSMLEGSTREIGAVDTSLKDRSLASKDYDVHFTSDVDYDITARPTIWPWRKQKLEPAGHGRIGQKLSYDGLTMTLVPGTERAPAAGARYTVGVQSLDDVFAAAKKSLDVSTPVTKVPIPGDVVKVADLTFTARSPELAARFLEKLMLGYLDERHSWETENATAAESFVTAQLGSIRDSLDDVQKKLAEYRTNHSVVVLDDEAKALVDEIGKFEQQRFDTRIEVEALSAVDGALKKPKAPLEAFMFGEAHDPVLTGLATALSQAKQKLAEADSRFNAAAPDVQEQRQQVDAQLTSIQSYVTNRLGRERDNLSKLNGIIGQYETKLRTVPTAELGLAQLARESEVYSTLYSFLLKRQQETAIAKASTISKNRVLDAAEVPYLEKWPKVWLPLVGIVIGLMLGSVMVLLRGQVSGRLQHGLDIRRYLGRVPVFATIPRVNLPKRLKSDGAAYASEAERLSAAYLEAFRTLRTNLYDARAWGRGTVVLMTSPCNGDGKTTCAYSLASTLARAGTSVLLVDTDLRDDEEDLDAMPGKDLGAVLQGRDSWRNVTQEVTVSHSCQFQIIRGGAASAELLLTPAMRDFIAEARTTYDFVLLDSPSFPGLSDALVLASLADCVLSVIRLEHTHRKPAAENVQRLSASAGTYGLILNDVRS